jgi:hypothetical protein
MTILDKLIEKKDIIVYIDTRIAHLSAIDIMKFPPRQRGLIQERRKGQIKELTKLKDIISRNNLKPMGKIYWREREER